MLKTYSDTRQPWSTYKGPYLPQDAESTIGLLAELKEIVDRPNYCNNINILEQFQTRAQTILGARSIYVAELLLKHKLPNALKKLNPPNENPTVPRLIAAVVIIAWVAGCWYLWTRYKKSSTKKEECVGSVGEEESVNYNDQQPVICQRKNL